jgi:hypothetical protein
MELLPRQIADSLNLPEGYSAAKEVAKIQKAVFPMFKEQGFSSKGRCFNKANPDGTVRVIHFLTMPATSSQYGKFAVEIGVYIPEVWMFLHGSYGVKIPKTFDIGDCEVRCAVDPPGAAQAQDRQWEALENPDLTTRLQETLDEQAYQFFNRFLDRAAIARELEKNDASVPSVRNTAPFILAIMDAEAGLAITEAARREFESHLERALKFGHHHQDHENYVRALIART